MNFTELNSKLSKCSLKEAEALFKNELKNEKRKSFLNRIVSRIVAIKGDAEREKLDKAIAEKCNAPAKTKSRS